MLQHKPVWPLICAADSSRQPDTQRTGPALLAEWCRVDCMEFGCRTVFYGYSSVTTRMHSEPDRRISLAPLCSEQRIFGAAQQELESPLGWDRPGSHASGGLGGDYMCHRGDILRTDATHCLVDLVLLLYPGDAHHSYAPSAAYATLMTICIRTAHQDSCPAPR